MSPDTAVLDRLRTERNAWLCAVRPTGVPHVTPVWFVFVDGTWWIGSTANTVKVRVIATNPNVSLALEDGGSPVAAEGAARLRTTSFPANVVAAFAAKYDWDVTGGSVVLIDVPVTRWLMAGTPH